jgi:uncharacterized membrane protein YGL010W
MQAFREWFLDQMGMYAAYHRDWRNQATHHIGVPLIVFSLILALTQLHLGTLSGATVSAAPIILGLLLSGYIVATPLVGIFAAIFYALLFWLAAILADGPSQVLWTLVLSCFVGGWITQFIGHVFEGRRPALSVNAIQVFMAPPFLIAEILFALGLAQSLKIQIQSRAVNYLPKEPDSNVL